MDASTVSRQWTSRPADERFLSLTDLAAFVTMQRKHSAARVIPNRDLRAVPTAETLDADLRIEGPNGAPVDVTHWAFGQLAQRAGAPAGYLRELPAPLAADCINYGLRHVRDVESLGILLTKAEGSPRAMLRAATGPNYGRIWNETIVRALVQNFGDGITGNYRVPGEFGKRVPITKANTTLYASDRDLFVFLADEDHRIELPNRRDGRTGSLARGFMVQNSEVGAETLVYAEVLFDYLCSNRIIWGMADWREVRIRHTAGAPHRWVEEIMPALEASAALPASEVQGQLVAAQRKKIDDVDAFLRSRFNGKQVEAIKAAHVADEDRPIESLWDAATAVTAYARGIQWQNDRVDLERSAGKILALAA